MKDTTAAARYAKALFNVTEKRGETDRALEDLHGLGQEHPVEEKIAHPQTKHPASQPFPLHGSAHLPTRFLRSRIPRLHPRRRPELPGQRGGCNLLAKGRRGPERATARDANASRAVGWTGN